MSEKDDISSALASVTKKWKAEKRKADKDDRLLPSQYRFFTKSYRTTIREAAFEHMEVAYNKASANGRYYANARQIYYAIRPLILKDVQKTRLNSNYFTQQLLKDYLEDHSPDWKVVWDARGHFEEPHTGKKIGVGGIEVENYMRSWIDGIPQDKFYVVDREIKTKGLANRFSSVLFIEKEGFNEILKDAEISKKYDMAIISTKGMLVKAACDLLSHMQSITRIFALHDFDKSGFNILKTLKEGTRMASGCEFIDLGFRLADIEGLPSEDVSEGTNYHKAQRLLEECGATEEEIAFLIEGGDFSYWEGKRVELNAMMSDEFIEWIKKKLEEHEVQKMIPGKEELKTAYRQACFGQEIEKIIKEKKEKADEYDMPDDLMEQVKEYLEKYPTKSWDSAVWNIAEENEEET
ncbi:hypothetical protein ES703_93285 [subsurface metagenome]